MIGLEKARMLLRTGEYTCVILKGKTVYTSKQRGVKPLIELLTSGNNFSNSCAADRVVGKGAAFLYIRLGITELYAEVISRPALNLLSEHNIFVSYGTLTDNIINRRGDGICPFEAALLNISDTEEAVNIIQEMRI